MALDAVLVRSRRVQGQPRQQVVGYLASIRAQYRLASAHRAWFWTRVDRRLAVLVYDAVIRQMIEVRLARVVPRPTAADLEQLAVQRAALEQLAATLWCRGSDGSAEAERP
jgi:hypothetical protein